VTSNGCPENRIDCARVSSYLEANGWRIVDDPAAADLILFNACGLVQNATERSLRIVKTLQSQARNGTDLMVWGCLPKIDPQALAEVHRGPTFSESELSKLDEMLQSTTTIDRVHSNELIRSYPLPRGRWSSLIRLPLYPLNALHRLLVGPPPNLVRPDDESIYYIKASTGCAYQCSYCAVNKSRGQIRSKPLAAILDEFRHGLQQGYREFSLLGTDLGPQGAGQGYTLVDLLGEIVKEEGDFKIGLRNTHPRFLRRMLPALEPVVATGKIWFIGVPAESGSNRILKLMRRNHTVEDVKESVVALKMANPRIAIRTQILVGFPSETSADYAASVSLLKETKFDHVEVYRFDPRPGTEAAGMEQQIPYRTAAYRRRKMQITILLAEIRRAASRLSHGSG
jgi:tRNA A37 methylthiotransferase MiaB